MIRRTLPVLLTIWMVAACSPLSESEKHPATDAGISMEQSADATAPQQSVALGTPAREDASFPRGLHMAWRDFWMWIAFFPFRLS